MLSTSQAFREEEASGRQVKTISALQSYCLTCAPLGWNLTIHSSLVLMLLVKLTPSQDLPLCLHLVGMAP